MSPKVSGGAAAARAIGDQRRGQAASIGEIVRGKPGGTKPPGTRRTGQPVRRNSRHAGEREDRIWRPLGRTKREGFIFRDELLRTAKWYDRSGKLPGKHNGHLGMIGIQVLEALLDIVDFRTGRLEPAIATICERIRRSRAAVVRAMRRLKEHGFIDWIRRSEPTDNVGEAGPQVRQIPNAYGFDIARLPRACAAWIRKKLSSGPPPDCDSGRRDQDRQDFDSMLDQAPAEDQARVLAGDGALGEALASLGRSLDEREFK